MAPQKRRIIDGRKREYFHLVRDTLRELVAMGKAAPGLNPTVAAHSIIGMIIWMARWRRPNGKASLDQIIAQVTQIALAGVTAPRRRP